MDRTASDTVPPPKPERFVDALRATALPFVLSRLGILAVGLVAALAIGYDPPPNDSAAWRISPDPVHNLLARWDTYWYLDIATRGYRWNGNPIEQQNVVFFPLYPTLMALAGRALGGHPLVAGTGISLAAFWCALAYLRRWIVADFGDRIAAATVLLLCAFPFAIFFGLIYTESLFLLATIAALFHARRGEFGLAAIPALLAGLIRPNGCFLAIPLASLTFGAARDGRRALIARAAAVAAMAAPLIGVLIYTAFLQVAVGQGLAWMAGQAGWSHSNRFPRGLNQPAVTMSNEVSVPGLVIDIGNAAATAFALAGVLPVTRLFGLGFGLLIIASVVPPVALHGLMSLGRFTSVLFPLFVWLATVLDDRRRRLVLIAFAIGQALAAAFFFTWRPLV